MSFRRNLRKRPCAHQTPTPHPVESRPKLVKTPHPHYTRSITLPIPCGGLTCPECQSGTQTRAKRTIKVKDVPHRGLPCYVDLTFQRRYCRNCQKWRNPELPIVPGFLVTKALYDWVQRNPGPEMVLRQKTGLSTTRLRAILRGK